MALEQTKNYGIWMERGKKRFRFYTKNLLHGKKVYDEKLVNEKGIEYREWSVTKSKIGAALAKNLKPLELKEGDFVLYLGVASGTTASHISDIIGQKGLLFGVDIAPRVLRELYFLAKKRRNIAPILADSNHPESYHDKVCECDFLIQDIAQKNQLDIFLKNLVYLKKGGYAFLSIKSRSIDVVKRPQEIFEKVRRELEKKVKIVDYKTLDPLEKDHCVFLIKT